MSFKNKAAAAITALVLAGPLAFATLRPQPVWAAAATTDEAQRLTDLFRRYLGKPAEGQSGAVSVKPDGEAYRVEIDIAALLTPLSQMGIGVAKTENLVMVLTPRPDGTWQVKSDGLPPIGFVKDGNTTTISYDGYTFDGVFDPKLASFASSTTTMSSVTTGSSTDAGSSTARKSGAMQMTQSASDAGSGTIDLKGNQTTQDLHYALNEKLAPAGDAASAPVAIEAASPRMGTEVSISHLPIPALLDLWAFLVAHPSRQEITAHQPELKSLLTAALTPDTKGVVKSSAEKLTVTLPQGQVKADLAGERLELGGLGPDDQLSLALNASALSLPPGLAPAWAAGLVPKDVDLSVGIGPVHLHNALRKMVQDADFSADKPISDDAHNEVVQAFADPLSVVLTLAPTTIRTDLLSVKAEGSVHLGPMGGPVGSANISSTGLDKAIESLQSSAQSAPEAGQALQFLMLAKQLGKSELDGSTTWRVEASPAGPITINGQSLGAGSPTKPKKKQKLTP